MAFMGIMVTFVFILGFLVGTFLFGVGLIIAGALLVRKTLHKTLGLVLKIVGYFLTVPIIFVILLLAVSKFI
jgi:hypothetical protein